MAKSRKKPSVWGVRWGDDVLYVPPPKPRKRKTPAQKLDAIVLRALREYGRHCRECGRNGWMPFQPDTALEYKHAQRGIHRVLREVARG